MNKLKSIAFAVLYLFITVAAQFLLAIVLGVQMMLFGFLNGTLDRDLSKIGRAHV